MINKSIFLETVDDEKKLKEKIMEARKVKIRFTVV